MKRFQNTLFPGKLSDSETHWSPYFIMTNRLLLHSLTTEYSLELIYRKPFLEIWHEEKDDPELGPLSERMGVRARGGGELLVSDEELDAASKDFVLLC